MKRWIERNGLLNRIKTVSYVVLLGVDFELGFGDRIDVETTRMIDLQGLQDRGARKRPHF